MTPREELGVGARCPQPVCGWSPDTGAPGGQSRFGGCGGLGSGHAGAEAGVWGERPQRQRSLRLLKGRSPQEVRRGQRPEEEKPRVWEADSPRPEGPRAKAGTSPEPTGERAEPGQGKVGPLGTGRHAGSRGAGEWGSKGVSPGPLSRADPQDPQGSLQIGAPP